jgi:hypothetical protein
VGHDSNPSGQASEFAAASEPSFIPLCPRCNYDLRGIPDGVCPECGKPFARRQIIDDLERNWSAQLAYRNVSPDALLFVLLIPTLLQLPALFSTAPRRGGDPAELWSLILWIGTIYWAWRGRWIIFRPSPLRLCWMVVPIVWGALPFISGRPMAWTDLAISGIGTGAVIMIWALTRPWRLWVPLALVSTLLLAPSMAFGLVGGGRMLCGLTWSHVRDIRTGQIYQQYPLRNDELAMLGLVGIVPGLLLAAIALVVAIGERTVRPSK